MKNEKLGKILKDFRKNAGLSQRAVADAIAATDKAVSSYETGRVEPPFSILCQLLKLYNVTLGDLGRQLESDGEGASHPLADVGPALATLREKAGCSKEKLAEVLNWPIHLVNRLESRGSDLSLKDIGQFLEIFDYNFWDLAQAFDFVTNRPYRRADPVIKADIQRSLESSEIGRAIVRLMRESEFEDGLDELRSDFDKLRGDQGSDDSGGNGKDP